MFVRKIKKQLRALSGERIQNTAHRIQKTEEEAVKENQDEAEAGFGGKWKGMGGGWGRQNGKGKMLRGYPLSLRHEKKECGTAKNGGTGLCGRG